MDHSMCDELQTDELTPSEAILAQEFQQSEEIDLYNFVDRYMFFG